LCIYLFICLFICSPAAFLGPDCIHSTTQGAHNESIGRSLRLLALPTLFIRSRHPLFHSLSLHSVSSLTTSIFFTRYLHSLSSLALFTHSLHSLSSLTLFTHSLHPHSLLTLFTHAPAHSGSLQVRKRPARCCRGRTQRERRSTCAVQHVPHSLQTRFVRPTRRSAVAKAWHERR